MALVSRLDVNFASTMTGAGDFGPPTSVASKAYAFTLSSGTGLGAANLRFSDTRVVAQGATDSLDLAGGGLVDALGVTFAPARLKAIGFYSYGANTVNLTLTVPAAGVKWISVAAGVTIPPGGGIFVWCPSAAGYVVTAATADLIDVVAAGGSGDQTYDILLLGASA